MLTPVNVTAPSSTSLKPHATATDIGAGHSPVVAAANPQVPVGEQAGIDAPAGTLMANVNAVTATAGSQTVLQSLALNVAALLNLTRRNDETLTALFVRIATAIDSLSQAERLQIEVRSGLKALKISLTDLSAALKNPDGADAARLTAMAEAPLATPGKTAVNAATTTYLQQGTANGHTEETLAMRAAARSNAAGLGLFSPEAKSRPAEAAPGDAKVLQNQLKTLFEPNAAEKPDVSKARSATTEARPATAEAKVAPSETRPLAPEAKLTTAAAVMARADGSMIKFNNTQINQPAAEALREIAREIVAENRLDAARIAEKAETGDQRLQTILTLKGFAEVITSLPARAAELLTGLPASDPAEPHMLPNPAKLIAAAEATEITDGLDGQPAALEDAARKLETNNQNTTANPIGEDNEAPEQAAARAAMIESQNGANAAADDKAALVKPGLAHDGVPFAYATLQPAKEKFAAKVEEEDTRDHDDDSENMADDGDGSEHEQRRARDEYDEMKDDVANDQPALVITRDSSEADRAFALYRRMGGF